MRYLNKVKYSVQIIFLYKYCYKKVLSSSVAKKEIARDQLFWDATISSGTPHGGYQMPLVLLKAESVQIRRNS